jgi:FkbM family methyltransferase
MPASIRARFLNLCLQELSETERFRLGIPSVIGVLQSVKENGFAPQTIVDIGAHVGGWSWLASQIFPLAKFFMIEANPDHEAALKDSLDQIGQESEYAILLLGPEERSATTFYKLDTGSSALPELTSFQRTEVTLPMSTLDGFMHGRECRLPILLKLDVQGFELEVLGGAMDVLARSELVVMETSLIPYNENAPLFAEVVRFMAQRDFVVFDFCGQLRRETDHALFQADVVFVRKDSSLRAARKFWLREP